MLERLTDEVFGALGVENREIAYPTYPARVQFAIGGPLTGAPLHFHGSAFNFALAGTKRWFLLPPESAVFSNMPIARWLGRADLRPPPATGGVGALSTCVQRAGDLLFVPRGWTHGVLNLRNAVCASWIGGFEKVKRRFIQSASKTTAATKSEL